MTAIALKLTVAPAIRPAIRRPNCLRVLADRADLVAVPGLLGSSAVDTIHTLLHLA